MRPQIIGAILLVTLACPAIAEERVVDYVDPYAAAMGVRPEVGAVFSLEAMTLSQKTANGFILQVNPQLVQTLEMASARAWLKTKSQYRPGTDISHKHAKMVGLYKYFGLDGFDHQIYAFEEVKEEETPQ